MIGADTVLAKGQEGQGGVCTGGVGRGQAGGEGGKGKGDYRGLEWLSEHEMDDL
jgi:hypothetical protein